MGSFCHIDENKLLLRMQQGDEEAFTELYNRYWKPLFTIAAHKLKNLSEAEEVVQDIFLDIWKRRAGLSVTSCFSTYLAICVKYRVINILARRNRHLRYQQYTARTGKGHDHTIEQWLQFEELKAQLSKETNKLSEKCRLVFQLSREAGYSQKQIAGQLGISEKTVESHLTKALRILRGSLGQLLVACKLFIKY